MVSMSRSAQAKRSSCTRVKTTQMYSEAGLTALVIEGEHVDRFRERPKADP